MTVPDQTSLSPIVIHYGTPRSVSSGFVKNSPMGQKKWNIEEALDVLFLPHR